MKGRKGYYGDNPALITLSAPLIRSLMTPLSLTMTLILFLLESNSNDLSNLTRFSYPLISNVYSLADAPLKR